MSAKLSPRLTVIANRMPSCETAADVGCDHAKLAIWLAQNNRVKRIIATDIRNGPLFRAEENVKRAGLEDRITLRQCDGLDGVARTDAVIIAGMGGDTIAGILHRAEWTRKSDCTLILQPMTAADGLRLYLAKNGYLITHENYAREGDKIYVVLTATQGKTRLTDSSELYVSAVAKDDILVTDYIDNIVNRLSIKHCGLQNARDIDVNEIESTVRIIDALKKRRKSYAKGI